MFLLLSVSGQVWMRSCVTIGATQKRAFDILLSRKGSRLNTFAMLIVSGLWPRSFFGSSIGARRR